MSEALLAALWRTSWQGALVIAVLWCLCRVMETNLPADGRCWLWRLSYIKILLGFVIVGRVALPILPASQKNLVPQSTVLQTAYLTAVPAKVVREAMPPTLALSPEPRDFFWSWQSGLVTLYLAGVGICLLRLLRAGLRTRRLKQAAIQSIDTNAIAELEQIALRFGLRNVPKLMVSEGIEIPVYTSGAVLLPAAAVYEAREHRLILAHELAHARRHDLIWEWLGTLTQTLFFFHPLVIIARREERLARESAADSLALRITEAPASVYGNLLLAISLSQPGKTLAGAIGVIENGSLLHRRLLSLKENSLMSASQNSRIMATVVASVLSAAVFVPWQLKAGSSQVHAATSQPATTAEKAKAAIESGDTKAAAKYALQMLAKNTDTKDWNYGNIIHGANQILGLAALQENHVEDAKRYLLAAGSTSGSPSLNTFGPDMVLAQRLLNQGEKDVVIRYLDLVARFWAHSSAADMAQIEKRHPGYTEKEIRMNRDTQIKIDDWKQQIQAGKKPMLNMGNTLLTIGPSNTPVGQKRTGTVRTSVAR